MHVQTGNQNRRRRANCTGSSTSHSIKIEWILSFILFNVRNTMVTVNMDLQLDYIIMIWKAPCGRLVPYVCDVWNPGCPNPFFWGSHWYTAVPKRKCCHGVDCFLQSRLVVYKKHHMNMLTMLKTWFHWSGSLKGY